MLKVLILCLLSASLAKAGFFTPTTDKHGVNQDTAAVKEGHSVVIELEEDEGNTKVSVSPKDNTGNDEQEMDARDKISGKMEETKEKIKDVAASVLPGRHQARREEIIDGEEADEARMGHAAGDMKERVKESISGLSSAGKNKAGDIKEGAMETAKRAKEEAERKVEGVKEKAKETAQEYSARTKEEGKKGMKGLFGYFTSTFRKPFKMLSRGWRALASLMYMMGLAVAYGMCVWVTFGSGRVLTGALPRVQLLMVQSKIQPVYFRAMAASVGAALVGYMMGLTRKRGMLGGLDLVTSLAMVLANMLYVEPRSSKAFLERMRKEKEEGVMADVAATTTETREEGAKEKRMRKEKEGVMADMGATTAETREEGAKEEAIGEKKDVLGTEKPRGKIIRRVHLSSSLLNVGTLVALTWHLVRVAQQLQAVC